MSQQPGFDVMDIDTSIANDPKFRRIHRTNADLVSTAFMAYVALLGESWKAAERVTIEDAWPALLPFDTRAVEAMQTAGLIDSDGRIPTRAWRKRFAEANKRRIAARARWRRHNDKRGKSSTKDDGESALEPRGSDVDTATSVPSVPFRPSVRSAPSAPNADARETDERYDAPEMEALAWLAQHKVALSETNGLRLKLIRLVEQFGTTRVIGSFDRLARAGVMDGDGRNFVFKAEEMLYPEPDLKALDREERAEEGQASFDRRVAQTQRMLREMRGESA